MDWYYASNGQQMGPVSQEELLGLFEKGEVKGSDLVWNESMTDWVAFRSVPDLNPPAVSTDPGGAETPPPMQQEPAVLTPAVATAGSGLASQEKVPTYLWQSITLLVISFFLCCICAIPAAIPALVYATKVDPALRAGDLEAAREASKKAGKWCLIALILGIVSVILGGLLSLVLGFAEQL